jgi:hypothetical protein
MNPTNSYCTLSEISSRTLNISKIKDLDIQNIFNGCVTYNKNVYFRNFDIFKGSTLYIMDYDGQIKYDKTYDTIGNIAVDDKGDIYVTSIHDGNYVIMTFNNSIKYEARKSDKINNIVYDNITKYYYIIEEVPIFHEKNIDISFNWRLIDFINMNKYSYIYDIIPKDHSTIYVFVKTKFGVQQLLEVDLNNYITTVLVNYSYNYGVYNSIKDDNVIHSIMLKSDGGVIKTQYWITTYLNNKKYTSRKIPSDDRIVCIF